MMRSIAFFFTIYHTLLHIGYQNIIELIHISNYQCFQPIASIILQLRLSARGSAYSCSMMKLQVKIQPHLPVLLDNQIFTRSESDMQHLQHRWVVTQN
jgi:hypothetical protein